MNDLLFLAFPDHSFFFFLWTNNFIFLQKSGELKVDHKNSAFYFRIENCTLFNSGLGNYTSNEYEAGIKLVNTRNGKIIDNNCSGNNGVGIMLSDGCNYNTISRNNVSNNGQYGIFLYQTCFNNLISQNNVSVNHYCGIYLTKDCNYNNILKNNISENNIGIAIFNECR